MERCEVAGTQGRFVLDDMWREVTLYPAGDGVKHVYTNPVFGGYRGFDDTFRARLHAFLEHVAAEGSPEKVDGSGLTGLSAQKVIAAAIESLESGTIVNVNSI
jgi:predicted dehydrogenase